MSADGVRRARALLIVILAACLAPGGAGAQEIGEDAGAQEGALFLLLPVGAQGVGLGRAMTALSSEEGAFWNPAGLAGFTERRALVYRGDQLAGEATAATVLFPWNRVGTFGISYLLVDIGDQDLRDAFGDVLGSISVRNHVGIASFATSFPGRIHAGINMKLVQFRVACRGQCPDLETTSSAYAIDVGVQAEPFSRIPLRFGWMIAHAGTEFQILNEEQSDPLPTRVRFAAAYEVLHRFVDDGLMDLWVTLETEDRARDLGSPSLYMGLRFSAADLFFVRTGYVGGQLDQTDGATVGVGFRLDRFDLNLAQSLTRSMVTGESQPIHVTLGVQF
ncbi:MAG: PorV/PorQ family protein [Gemmatimonadetes bacterium]|nr:PorV/PorQ family protein [Gemmatimonadota bacterium]